MISPTNPRCALCAARALGPTGRALRYPGGARRAFAFACASCGLLLNGDPADPEASPGPMVEGDYACPPDAAFGFDLYTLRIAAFARTLRAVPANDAQARALAEPHSDLAAAARLVLPGRKDVRPISLGVICKSDEVEAALGLLASHASFAADAAILADGPHAPPRPVEVEGFASGAIRLAYRPLCGDFAAQRNALQDLARQDWMLQLDCDETLAPGLGARLPVLASLAEADGLVSIGLTRRNLVDGTASDVFPDVQYRLNRRKVRFAGHVHERPERPWARSVLVPGAGIEHHLTRERVLSRSRVYEAMAPGRGRPEEEDALRAPYRD